LAVALVAPAIDGAIDAVVACAGSLSYAFDKIDDAGLLRITKPTGPVVASGDVDANVRVLPKGFS
jgi:hypothetical protein